MVCMASMRGHSAFGYLDYAAIAIGLYLWTQGVDPGMWILGFGLLIYVSGHGFI
jgi:hypothetical protein